MSIDNEQNRRNWIAAQLKKLPAGSRLLDAGAGEQQYRQYCSHLQYVSQDFAEYKPENLDSGLQMQSWDYGRLDIVSDITSIPEPDGSFDAVLCAEVFEHIPEPVKAIYELSRLLKKNGTLILTAPFASMTHFAPFHFSTGFNRFFYEHHLPAAGLKIDKLSYNGNYFDYLGQELRRVDQMAIKFADDRPSFLEYQALKKVRAMVERFASKGQASAELLTCGIHVLAHKL